MMPITPSKIYWLPLLALADFAMTLFAFLFVNWWAPLFAVQRTVSDRGYSFKGTRLPNWLAWFDTFDASLDAGLKIGETGTFFTRVRWLYRNPAYGFGYWVLGIEFNQRYWEVIQFVPPDEKGNVQFMAVDHQNGYFNYNIIKWGIHWKLGWKAWNYYLPGNPAIWNADPWGPEYRLPFTFSFSLPKK